MMLYNITKRVTDICFSLVAMYILWPIFLIICIIIKLDSKGPCVFKQTRVGKNKKPFLMYKFRTMVNNADNLKNKLKDLNEADGPVFKIKDDPRLTKIGKFLRDTNLDELPQLFNVFLGNMSLIGPRPALVEEVDRYEKEWYNKRLKVNPGMASLFHIKNKKGINYNFDEWMRWDVYYVDNRNIWFDLYILAKVFNLYIKQIFFSITIVKMTLRFLGFIHHIDKIANWPTLIKGALFNEDYERVILKNGILFYVPQHTVALRVIKEIWFDNVYTPDFLPIDKNDVVVDIGAHIGIFSIFAASQTIDAVCCYEPHPMNFGLLKKNVIENNLHNIYLFKNAVGGASGLKRLYIGKKSEVHSLFKNQDLCSGHHIEVDSITLEEVFKDNRLEKIDFLKMDCEDAEYEILFSCKKDILDKIRKISMEYHDCLPNHHHKELVSFLESLGFYVKVKEKVFPLGYLYAIRK